MSSHACASPLGEPACMGQHLQRLRRAALRLCGCRDLADDLVQETYAAVLARPRQVHAGAELGYLLAAMRNVFVSQARKAACRPQAEDEPEHGWELADERTCVRPDTALAAKQVWAALEHLPAEQRGALVAVDVVGLSYREAAAALDVPVGTVMSRLARARDAAALALAA